MTQARTSLALAVAAIFLSSCATVSPQTRAYLEGFEDAERRAVAFAPITDTVPQASLTEAYALQQRLIARRVARGDRVAGYRGSLMSQASLKSRGVSEPLVGVLFGSGAVSSGGSASLCGYRKASFEMKLGYAFAQSVSEPPADIISLQRAVGQIVPIVDLPDIAYRNPDKYSAVDMVASNISASRYVVGSRNHHGPVDLDNLKVMMTSDGETVASGLGRESFDSQWQSLAMVVQQILKSGRHISPGDLVLTGRIGERGWLPPGAYRADYGPLGTVEFTVAPCA